MENPFNKSTPKIEKNSKVQNLDAERNAFFFEHGYTRVNKILGYQILPDTYQSLHIHLAPANDLGVGEKIRLIKDGFKKLAVVISSNTDIQKVYAVSWIVARQPKFMEKMGFEIEDSIDVKLLLGSMRVVSALTNRDTRPRAMATMSREKFLERYLN